MLTVYYWNNWDLSDEPDCELHIKEKAEFNAKKMQFIDTVLNEKFTVF